MNARAELITGESSLNSSASSSSPAYILIYNNVICVFDLELTGNGRQLIKMKTPQVVVGSAGNGRWPPGGELKLNCWHSTGYFRIMELSSSLGIVSKQRAPVAVEFFTGANMSVTYWLLFCLSSIHLQATVGVAQSGDHLMVINHLTFVWMAAGLTWRAGFSG